MDMDTMLEEVSRILLLLPLLLLLVQVQHIVAA
jgi:hypothetical protein